MTLSATLAFAGCSASDRYLAIEQRDLPAKPDYVRPVDVPLPAPTAKWRDVAGAEHAGRVKANRIITCFASWYDHRRADYAAIGAAKPAAGDDPCAIPPASK